MTKQTEAMKLALEALEGALSDDKPYIEKSKQAIVALREALAEQPAQQEPVALPEKMYEFVPTPEPIKWHHPECEGQCIACLIEQVVQEAYGSQGLGYLQRHLTSPPAQRKPLTDEAIKLRGEIGVLAGLLKAALQVIDTVDGDDDAECLMLMELQNKITYAIRSAHGIKGDA